MILATCPCGATASYPDNWNGHIAARDWTKLHAAHAVNWSVRIPSVTMEQEFARHYDRGFKDGVKSCAHPEKSAEQKARDMLERMEVPGAQQMTAGELVELANLIAYADAAEKK